MVKRGRGRPRKYEPTPKLPRKESDGYRRKIRGAVMHDLRCKKCKRKFRSEDEHGRLCNYCKEEANGSFLESDYETHIDF